LRRSAISQQRTSFSGRGLKIIGELIKSLDGRFEQKFGTIGSMSIVIFPYRQKGSDGQMEQEVIGLRPAARDADITFEGAGAQAYTCRQTMKGRQFIALIGSERVAWPLPLSRGRRRAEHAG
jgi:hypothetical protein